MFTDGFILHEIVSNRKPQVSVLYPIFLNIIQFLYANSNILKYVLYPILSGFYN